MAIKKKTSRKMDGGDETAKSTSYTVAKTRKQLNKEKANAIRAGYGAKQPTARDARKVSRKAKSVMSKMSKSSSKATKKRTNQYKITGRGVRSGGDCGSSASYSGTGGVCRNKKTMKKYR